MAIPAAQRTRLNNYVLENLPKSALKSAFIAFSQGVESSLEKLQESHRIAIIKSHISPELEVFDRVLKSFQIRKEAVTEDAATLSLAQLSQMKEVLIRSFFELSLSLAKEQQALRRFYQVESKSEAQIKEEPMKEQAETLAGELLKKRVLSENGVILQRDHFDECMWTLLVVRVAKRIFDQTEELFRTRAQTKVGGAQGLAQAVP